MSTTKEQRFAGVFEIVNGTPKQVRVRDQLRELQRIGDEYGVPLEFGVIGEYGFCVMKMYGHLMSQWPQLGRDFEVAKERLREYCMTKWESESHRAAREAHEDGKFSLAEDSKHE